MNTPASYLPLALLFSGCQVNTTPPAAPTARTQTAVAASDVSANESAENTDPPAAGVVVAPPPAPQVSVFIEKRLDRPSEVVGVLDFHTSATSSDKGFNELRARAAALGADAVISAEFEHGEGGGPSHLSGIAVRYLDR